MDSQVKIDEEYCNGGAIAIKGFNYQHAVASLIIISNYKKDDFCIYLETKDDLEVELENKHLFVQVKSSKLSINDLTKPDKKSNESILSKNLKNNSSKETRYKIITPSFKDKAKNELKSISKGFLFQEIYQYSEEQKLEIISKLSSQGLSEKEIKDKLSKSYVYFSPFVDNAEQAYTFLLGIMNQNKINIDYDRGQNLLNELLKLIAQKSEKKVNCDEDKQLKKIDSDYIKSIFKSSQFEKARHDLADELKEKGVIDFKEHYGVKRALCEINIKHNALRQQLEKYIGNFTIDDAIKTFKDLSNTLSLIFPSIKKELLYGLVIDLYISKLEDDYNDN